MRFSFLHLAIITVLCFSQSNAQVVINEVSAAQNTGYSDEDGDFPDWIELYNTGSTAVDLKDYELVLIDNNEVKWKFPSIYIQPNDHLVIFASEKDRRVVLDHWEVPIAPQVNWNYYTGPGQPPANWNTIAFNPGSWSVGPGGIGYGDNDDSTIIAQTTTLYMRTEFILLDTSEISVGLLGIDYDDSFIAYLNGVELSRFNVGIPNVPAQITDLAYEEHEAKMYQGGGPEFFYIDIDKMNAAKKPGNNVFSVEIHNVDPLSDDMSAIPYFLIGKTNPNVTYFPFPASTNLHTNFNISSFPSRIKLYDDNGVLADEVILKGMRLNHSYGRTSDGTQTFCLFDSPTPDTTNVLSSCFKRYADPPAISLDAGFYSGTQTVSLSSNEAGAIRYSLDGSIPTSTSTL